ncbi:oxidoreductase [Thermogymnomonas acidicola]|uniref:Oxidoreductase n=1 Tax=Thermogymnomonas acidicola TaxID=399579 RepID=A0AA37F8L0_9ARCH|nr:sulfite oxidase-like oxidoreductase [Thermogymnomonas acidicola]GGM66507.1 oxidoreductase [Thermogymnomonas acidicola]
MLKKEGLPPGQRYGRKFIIYADLGIPDVDIERYRLRVNGLVERELEFTYDELKQKATMEYVRDFHCVTRWSIKDVRWKGVPMLDIIREAGVKGEAKWVMFHCIDGYTAPVPMEYVTDGQAMVALYMNGEPLSLEQGFPARPFMPNLYGWKSAKWLNGIEFIADYEDGYWEERGYHEVGDVNREERFKDFSASRQKKRPVL